ncbi:hypothetical protein [Singulisphaera acidiphila]|uniref:hypothetical protein n=1 Tax=Singulisphaera acidiphila TaxID=466153 RepID=UPI000373EE65|nr:hypothetical protein [Singulisphaera acidiphila]
MKLASEWLKELNHVKQRHSPCSPPRPPAARPLAISHLWSLLTDEQRQRTLVILSGIVLRQLEAPRDDPEVRDELS